MDAAQADSQAKPVSIDRLLKIAGPDMAGVDAMIRDRMQSPVAVIPALAEHLIGGSAKSPRPPLAPGGGGGADGGGPHGLPQSRSGGGVHPYRDPAP